MLKTPFTFYLSMRHKLTKEERQAIRDNYVEYGDSAVPFHPSVNIDYTLNETNSTDAEWRGRITNSVDDKWVDLFISKKLTNPAVWDQEVSNAMRTMWNVQGLEIMAVRIGITEVMNEATTLMVDEDGNESP